MNEMTTTPRSNEAGRDDEAALLPLVDVIEDAEGITLRADMAGVPKENLDLQIEADTLTIGGEMALRIPDGMEASHVEVGLPRYRRAFTLSKELDTSKVVAEFSQGVLKLRIPKFENAQPRRIQVQVA
jgi:HSP20 family molecular chaperone IbpA